MQTQLRRPRALESLPLVRKLLDFSCPFTDDPRSVTATAAARHPDGRATRESSRSGAGGFGARREPIFRRSGRTESPVKRRPAAIAIICAAVLAIIVPLGAVTDGALDGNGHPAVLLLVMDVNGSPAFRCSGTLISPTVFLTAGHCAGEPGEFSGMRVFTESDVQNGNNNYPFAGANSVEAVTWSAHPLFTEAQFF